MIQIPRVKLSKLQELLRSPRPKRSADTRRSDQQWMVWGIVNILNLSIIVLLMALGIFREAEYLLIEHLGSFPFHISAEEAQVSLINQTDIFILCTLVSLYLSAVILRENRARFRAILVIFSLLTLILSVFLGLIWGGILNMCAPLCCVLTLWMICEIIQLFRAQAIQKHPRP